MYFHVRPRPEPVTEHLEPAFGAFGTTLFVLAGTAMGGLFGLIAGATVVEMAIKAGNWALDSVALETYMFNVGILAGCLCAGLGCQYGLYLANLPRDRTTTSLPPPLSLRHTEHVPHAGGDAMSATVTPPPKVAVQYPSGDGKPMADNTVQFRWIMMLYSHLAAQYRDDANTFVAGDHLIYPTEGDNKLRQAPDVYVAFGPPKGDRPSYRVWEEGGIFPQVIFEVWSPGNRYAEMQDKFTFYEKYGAEEYYILYPEFPMHAEAFRRDGGKLARVAEVNGYVSPRTDLRFALETGQLTVSGRDGRPLRTVEELAAEREAAERVAREQQDRADKLAAKLRELGVDPDAV